MQTNFKPGTSPARVKRAARRLAQKAVARELRTERKALAMQRVPTAIEQPTFPEAFAASVSRSYMVLPIWLLLMMAYPDGAPATLKRRLNAKTAA